MRGYILPFGDFVAWCLMPNHFHWQFHVRRIAIPRKVLRKHVDEVEYLRRVHQYGEKAQAVKRDWTRISNPEEPISLNTAIGDLLKGYTTAINKQQENRSGSLWRAETKAEDGWIEEFVTLKKNGQTDYRFQKGNDYAYQCFCYIHDNPSKAGLVKQNTDYPWSSAQDYAGLRKGTLCNLDMGRNLRDFL
ncbi:MAG: hypothetical protein AAFO82_08445 [Bacteroidota bacterium]